MYKVKYFFAIIVLSINSSYAQSETGTSSFFSLGEYGALIISGNAAEVMYKELQNGGLHREPKVDYSDRTLTGRQITRENVEAYIGKSYICQKFPSFDSEGNLLRDSFGNIYSFNVKCFFSIQNVKTGEI